MDPNKQAPWTHPHVNLNSFRQMTLFTCRLVSKQGPLKQGAYDTG